MTSFQDIVRAVGHTDKDTAHTYGPWYDRWFAPLRDKPLNILEVGVCVFGGGCVLAFAEYFPKATVWAVDIDRTRCNAEVFNHPRIKFIHDDAYRPELVNHFGDTRFDIVVDDASHEVQHQMQLLRTLRPRLKDDGFYVVEDVCTGHWLPHLREVWNMGLRHTLIDMSTPTCYDNTLLRLEPRP